MPRLSADAPCPCGSLKTYGACCGKYHAGDMHAETAENLMRSRYCAFVLRDGAYLLSTLAAENRSGFDVKSIADDTTRWTGLQIIECVDGGILDQTGSVEFIAEFEEDGHPGRLQERSRFERRDGKWFYVDGVFPATPMHSAIKGSATALGQPRPPMKAGRNAPCPCGSGKKFKKCCG